MLASSEFMLEYQKGADNGAADALSCIPICHNHATVWSLLEGAIMAAMDRGEAEVSEELLDEHECLGNEARVHAYCGLMHNPVSCNCAINPRYNFAAISNI